MKRSYIALAVVIIASAIALFIHLQPPDQAVVQPSPDKKAVEPPTAPDKAKAVVPPTPPDKKAPEPKAEPKAKAEPKGKAETPAPADIAAVLKAVDAHLAARKPVEAMKALSDAIAKTTDPAAAAPLKKRQTELVNVHYFSSRPSPVATTYTVAAGDILRRIAANHNATDSYVARLNGIKDKDRIRIGQRLKIVQGGFDAEIVKSQYLLAVTKDGIWIRDIKVGLGKDGATPIGAFIAGPKITEPPYTAV
ncbi:LysM peptidoglycan-binding domain-containing protein, partial [bacterium]|nr:LysM peptidoglycan-binding domain-containing protein [bacterium]